MLTRSRVDVSKNPNIPAIQKWLAARYETELAKATTKKEIQKVIKLYKDVPDDYIWIEYVKTPVAFETGKYLCCFSVLRKGYAFLDAKLTYTTLSDVITHFSIPVKEVATYADLVAAIKDGQTSILYKVKAGSGQYGIVVDNRLSDLERYNSIISTLGGVSFNIAVNYTGSTFSTSNPHVGEVSLMWNGFNSASLEVYPLEEIISS